MDTLSDGLSLNVDLLEVNLVNLVILDAALVYLLGSVIRDKLDFRLEGSLRRFLKLRKRETDSFARLTEWCSFVTRLGFVSGRPNLPSGGLLALAREMIEDASKVLASAECREHIGVSATLAKEILDTGEGLIAPRSFAGPEGRRQETELKRYCSLLAEEVLLVARWDHRRALAQPRGLRLLSYSAASGNSSAPNPREGLPLVTLKGKTLEVSYRNLPRS
jgi:hypothetical protein